MRSVPAAAPEFCKHLELRLIYPLPKRVAQLASELHLRPESVDPALAILDRLGLVRFRTGEAGRLVEAV